MSECVNVCMFVTVHTIVIIYKNKINEVPKLWQLIQSFSKSSTFLSYSLTMLAQLAQTLSLYQI
jgi:hypothetical protein